MNIFTRSLLVVAVLTGGLVVSVRQVAAYNPEATNSLYLSVTSGNVQGVQDALSQGADPNAADSYGYTFLHMIARGAGGVTNPDTQIAIIEQLVRAGANPNITAHDKTPDSIALDRSVENYLRSLRGLPPAEEPGY
jgi:ankyrin repeat protein